MRTLILICGISHFYSLTIMFCFNFGTESWNWKIRNWKLWHTFKPPLCTYSSGFSYGGNFSLEPNNILRYSYREVCMGLLPALGNVGFSEDVLSYTVHVTIPRRKHLTWCRSRMQALVVQEQDWALLWETVHPPSPMTISWHWDSGA